jgi:sulfatase modifying factor 1
MRKVPRLYPRVILLLAVSLTLSILPALAPAVEMEMVYVGNPGNPADTRHDPTGFGAVDYGYWIGKYEVTYGQYREFLNAKATVGDPHSLYNDGMAGAILRLGTGLSESPWIYEPQDFDPAFDALPVDFVTMWDAARFVNWLHNGKGNGDTESGAYTGLDLESTFQRQPGARYHIPTENEWYKAAYYDPNKPGGAGYWEFPTRSDTSPSNDLPPGSDLVNGSANFGTSATTPVGAFAAKPSTSAYGTYDQGGNLWEWNETFVIDDYFGLRGGAFANVYGLNAAHRDSYPAFFENPIMGFRVASTVVPEPSTLALLAVGGLIFSIIAVAIAVGQVKRRKR